MRDTSSRRALNPSEEAVRGVLDWTGFTPGVPGVPLRTLLGCSRSQGLLLVRVPRAAGREQRGSAVSLPSLAQFEGVPTYPDIGRMWSIVDKYKVTKFYTAPTAIRLLMKHGEEPVKK